MRLMWLKGIDGRMWQPVDALLAEEAYLVIRDAVAE